jgi:hypothetical protein
MSQLSIDDIIELGDISVPLASKYQADGALFGKRLAFTAPSTIAIVTDALRWQWEGFPDITEVRATSTITIDTLGDPGQTITVTIDDPILGTITLGYYTISDTDATTDDIADNLGNALALNPYLYGISVVDDVITITAPEGEGALINGITPEYFITQVYFISTESDDRILTENNYRIITE